MADELYSRVKRFALYQEQPNGFYGVEASYRSDP
jgi:hypothetical protein